MTATKAAIDCDVHPAVPSLKALLPHFDDYWRNSIAERGIPGLRDQFLSAARADLGAAGLEGHERQLPRPT